jgi:exodeoxyribonuclease-3
MNEQGNSKDQLPKKLAEPDGYHAFWHMGEKKGYSGVALLSKEQPNEVISDFGKNNILSHEGRTILAKFDTFTLINAYFPNGKRGPDRLLYKMDYYKAFHELIASLRKKGENVIFCGDVNTAHKEIDLARPKANQKISGFLPIEREWIDEIIKDNFVDTFRMFNTKPEQYSWWDQKSRARDRNVGWRIDYFFVDKKIKKNVQDAYILSDVMGSDHAPVGIEYQI